MSSMQGFQLVGQELSISMLSVNLPKDDPKKPMDLQKDTDFGATGTGHPASYTSLVYWLIHITYNIITYIYIYIINYII